MSRDAGINAYTRQRSFTCKPICALPSYRMRQCPLMFAFKYACVVFLHVILIDVMDYLDWHEIQQQIIVGHETVENSASPFRPDLPDCQVKMNSVSHFALDSSQCIGV